jgi:4-hydroxybenzoate polyprenyltransferase
MPAAILAAVTTSAVAPTATAAALVQASHPLPSLAVTAFSTAVAAALGRSALGCLLVAAAVGTGQLSIGWSNDLLDRARDRTADRRDKPLATGAVPPATVTTACVLAVLCCVPLSLASGWRAGIAHLVAVGGGWAYNLGLKRTLLSFLPYAVSFGLLTAFLTLGLPGTPWPEPWALTAGALLGVGAHFLNVVPDVEADVTAGVRGLPQRMGTRRAAVVGAVLLGLAAALVVLGPAGPVPGWAWAGLALAGATAGLAAAAGFRRTTGKAPFLLAVATAAVAIALLLARGADLT